MWANAILGWIPVLLVLSIAEPASTLERATQQPVRLKETLAAVFKQDVATRVVFFNMVAWGVTGLVMFGPYQKYWQDSGVPLAYFGALYAVHNLVGGFGGRLAAVGAARYGRRALLAADGTARYGRRVLLAAVGVSQIIAYFGMAAYLGWGGIALGILVQVSRGIGEVLYLNALNERIASGIRATVISMASLSVRASFSLLGPLVGYGIDGWGLPSALSALGILYSIAFVVLLLPLILREAALSPARSTERA